jgi:Tfp pilus assembly protein PilP
MSCGKTEEKPAAPVHKPKAAVETPAVNESAAKPDLAELTAATRHRNPFVSHIMLTRGSEASKKIKGPLECCDVSTFKLVAVIVVPGKSSALVQAPDGKRYIVRNGDIIGPREGKIINIKDRSLTVREYILDEGGKIASSADTDLVLQSKEEARKPSR